MGGHSGPMPEKFKEAVRERYRERYEGFGPVLARGEAL